MIGTRVGVDGTCDYFKYDLIPSHLTPKTKDQTEELLRGGLFDKSDFIRLNRSASLFTTNTSTN